VCFDFLCNVSLNYFSFWEAIPFHSFANAPKNPTQFIITLLFIIYFNRNWVDSRWQQYSTHLVDTRWQQYSTHLHTNSTQNTESGTYITIKINKNWKCGPCPVFASYTLAFLLQLRKKHGKTSVRVVEKCPDIPVAAVQCTLTHTHTHSTQNTESGTYITIKKIGSAGRILKQQLKFRSPFKKANNNKLLLLGLIIANISLYQR
jgi:hypothetical protein